MGAHDADICDYLLGLGWAFEFGDELPELWVMAEVFQIVVGHQAIGILIAAVDGFMQKG